MPLDSPLYKELFYTHVFQAGSHQLSHSPHIRTVLSTAALASAAPAPTEPSADPTPASSSYSPFDEPDKSIAFYVGKDLTADGHTLLGGFGHEPSNHWVEIVPAQSHPEGSTITVGATEEAAMPGKLTEIPQEPETYRYITANYSEFEGFPAPLTNGGLNEKNVSEQGQVFDRKSCPDRRG